MSVLKDKNILLGVCGGIAAYKSIILLRILKKKGANVQVIFTPSAHDFVTSLTFFDSRVLLFSKKPAG